MRVCGTGVWYTGNLQYTGLGVLNQGQNGFGV